MDHRLTNMQLRKVTDQCIGVDGAARILTTTGNAFTEQIAFANQRQITYRIDKTMLCSANHQITPTVAGFIKTHNALRSNFNSREQFTQRFTAAFTFYREHHRTVERLEELTQRIQRRFLLCLNGRVWQFLKPKLAFAAFVGKCSVFSCTRGQFFSSEKSSSTRSQSDCGGNSGRIGSMPRFSKRASVSAWKRSALFSRSPVFTNSVLAGK